MCLSNQTVGVIGNGSSGVQIISELATQAKKLIIFQRTAQYAVPSGNCSLDSKEVELIKSDYSGFRDRNRQQSSAQLSGTKPSQRSALSVSPDDRKRLYEGN